MSDNRFDSLWSDEASTVSLLGILTRSVGIVAWMAAAYTPVSQQFKVSAAIPFLTTKRGKAEETFSRQRAERLEWFPTYKTRFRSEYFADRPASHFCHLHTVTSPYHSCKHNLFEL